MSSSAHVDFLSCWAISTNSDWLTYSEMRVAELSIANLTRCLSRDGINVRVGPVVVRLRSSIGHVIEGVHRLYADYSVEDDAAFCDFHVFVTRPANVRRWVRPQVIFSFDGRCPFKPLPLAQAFAMFEWGLNWCIANHSHQFLIIHAAVVEKRGFGAILAAPPGSGKSTLCAGLVNRGWRLLSDEMALVSIDTGRLVPIPRPISIKNQSIDVLRAFAPLAEFGRTVRDTAKGSVAHVKPPAASVSRASQWVVPAWVVFPKYTAASETCLRPRTKARAFMELGENAFNYSTLGPTGFDSLARLVDACDCFDFEYSRLDEAVSLFDGLQAPAAQPHESALNAQVQYKPAARIFSRATT